MRAPNVQGFSLRTKLVTFAAALVVVPGIIYGVLAVSSAERALTRVVGRELAEEARSAADRFATTLRSGRDRSAALRASSASSRPTTRVSARSALETASTP